MVKLYPIFLGYFLASKHDIEFFSYPHSIITFYPQKKDIQTDPKSKTKQTFTFALTAAAAVSEAGLAVGIVGRRLAAGALDDIL